MSGFTHKFINGLRSYSDCIRDMYYGMPRIAEGSLDASSVASFLGSNPQTILEIGCNDGADTKKMVETFPSTRFYCFEPDRRPCERFLTLFERNPRVELHAIAIGADDGETDFFMSGGARGTSKDWDQSGSIRRPKNHLRKHPEVQFPKKCRIPVRTLDGWCSQRGIDTIDFIWMDTQGSEADIIAGGTKMLKKTRYLYTEYSNIELYEGQVRFDQLLKSLPDFEVVRRYNGDVLLKNALL